jgi:ureidoglycolate hydrolase
MNKQINNITSKNFAKYGYVIEHDSSNIEKFQVVLNEFEQVGWRIAVSKVINKSIIKIARHPNTMESFEPVAGVTLVCVALLELPEEYEIFLLDKPVCVYKNIWHATFCLSEYSILKICENVTVESEEYEFAREIKVAIMRG